MQTESLAGAANNWNVKTWTEERTISAEQSPAADPTRDFEWLVREHARFLFTVAYSVLRNTADSEDAVQDALLRVYRNGEYGGVTDLRAWLARIVWRTALDRIPRRNEVALQEAEDRVMRSSATAIDDAVAERQTIALVHKLIATLPDELRDTLVLSTVKEMTSVEIASVLQIPEASVRTRLFRARQMLKQKLSALIGR